MLFNYVLGETSIGLSASIYTCSRVKVMSDDPTYNTLLRGREEEQGQPTRQYMSSNERTSQTLFWGTI